MTKSLVIVESPAKAKTINKYLGDDFIVKSSVGHVRDLPTSGNNAPVDAKARAKAAAITRKLSPAQKVKHKAKKAKEIYAFSPLWVARSSLSGSYSGGNGNIKSFFPRNCNSCAKDFQPTRLTITNYRPRNWL